MKTKHLPGALLSFLYTIIFFSCGNNDEKKIYSLSFEKEYYERPLLGTTNITITGGNRDYTVTVEKTDILNIDVDLSSSIGMGSLRVTPKKKGETKVKVKDNITNETVDLRIKITDSYLAYAIEKSNHGSPDNHWGYA